MLVRMHMLVRKCMAHGMMIWLTRRILSMISNGSG